MSGLKRNGERRRTEETKETWGGRVHDRRGALPSGPFRVELFAALAPGTILAGVVGKSYYAHTKPRLPFLFPVAVVFSPSRVFERERVSKAVTRRDKPLLLPVSSFARLLASYGDQ